MVASDIRVTFLNFFKQKKHHLVSSAPMVIKNDPTLMFTNAGMNQFKDLFLGNTAIKHTRIADTQKCLRVSGKHNDLEEVGVDTYHHTMFEMLGNWSFGDYFKKEAISWAWELLVDVYKIDKTKLYFTVFEGDKKDGTTFDKEAYDYWKLILEKNGLTTNQILKCDKKDNFWEMGETGPCGPCSEIHIDLRDDTEIAKIAGANLVNQDHPQVIEIWNLVFMEFNRMADGSLHPLPNKHVDTGLGFERLAMVLQGKKSNYDTDVFAPLIAKIAHLTNKKYTYANTKKDIAIRVIADHIRAVAFSIADGQLPSNTGAGYVIRRILRRAIRYGYSFLDIKTPFIYQLVEVLVNQMGEIFPELIAQQNIITKVIKEEESGFLRTLSKGIQRFEDYLATANDKMIDGKFAFELYDTFGFPIDLTQLLAIENNYHIDIPGFSEELLKQKERSRAATKIKAADWVVCAEDNVEEFIGYDYTQADIYLTKYRKINVKGEDWFQLVFSVTPFYAEGGGQVGDTGYIENQFEKIEIFDTKKENNLIIHYAKELPKYLGKQYNYKAVVYPLKRGLTACNHSATHLLHQALRKVLGNHVEQKGSLVNENYLRFDFSHFEKIKASDLQKIEQLINEKIKAQLPLNEHRSIPIKEAKKLGAMMLFEEKYEDMVRMIQFGDSRELCGGIHVKNTKEIELFKIKSEGAIAAGIRRIEALTSEGAGLWLKNKIEIINKNLACLTGLIPNKDLYEIISIKNELKKEYQHVSNLMEIAEYHLKQTPQKLTAINQAILDFTKIKLPKSIIDRLLTLKKSLAKQEEQTSKEKAKIVKEKLLQQIEKINEINVIAQKIDLTDSAAIKDLAFQLKGQVANLFLVLGAEINGKPNLTIVIADNLVKTRNLHAGNIIREAAKEMQGGGGGQPFYATAGGKNIKGIDAAISKAKSFLN